MKSNLRIALVALPLFLGLASALAQWTSVGEGIEYQHFSLAGPNNVFVTRMLASNPNCIIGTTIASNRIAGANETTSGQFRRSDDALNYWGNAWGQRNGVVVAINGSFSLNGVITGGHFQDSCYAKRFDDFSGQTGFVWKQDRSYFIGVCPHFQNSGQTISIGGSARNFDGINVARGTDQLIVYTPHYNNNTLTDNSGIEVLVAMPTPLLVPPSTVTGTIELVRTNQGATSIPFDHLVLSGVGSAASFLQSVAQVGRQVTISQSLQLYDGPSGNLCSVPDSRNFSGAYSLAQGNFVFLKNGQIQTTTDAGMTKRNPRTAVVYNAAYVFFVVCDGRSTQSVGWTSDEMASFCLNTLGATDGVNLDGGGSSAMVVNGVLKNIPSDGAERPIPNGLTMINLQPKAVSPTFAAGQSLQTTVAANVRLGPGTDYYAFTTVPTGTPGTVATNAVNGVYAKGYFWWNCSFGGTSGWVAETLLANTSPLFITQQPASQAVAPGGSAFFAVTAAGTSPLGYQWRLNGTNLAGATANTLTLSSVQAPQAGTYTVVLTNASGSLTSNPALLTLLPKLCTFSALAAIPAFAGDTTNEAHAITPDGVWSVGVSGGGANGPHGFLYDGTNLFNVIAGGAQSTIVTGVGYRTENGQQEIIMSGLSSGWNTDYMTTNGTVFGAKRRDTTVGSTPAAVLANGLAGSSSDVFYSTWYDANSSANQLYVGKASGAWPMSPSWDKTSTSGSLAQTHGVSSTGRAVGFRGGSKVHCVLDWTGSGTPREWTFNGLNGSTSGEAFAVNTDGTVIFGQSPVSDGRPGSWAYKALVTSAGPGALVSVTELPSPANTVGNLGSASLPFGCTPDGNYAVGSCYRGSERAVLWDTHDANPANWTVLDLTDLARTNSALGVFNRLARGYSIGTNGSNLIVAGMGIDNGTPANARAFLMTLSLPRTLVPTPPLVTIAPAAPGFTFSFDTVADAGITYYLEYATSLATPTEWTPLGSSSGAGTNVILFDPNPSGAQRFYRVRAQ